MYSGGIDAHVVVDFGVHTVHDGGGGGVVVQVEVL